MGPSFPLLSSVLLMIVVGLNQVESEPSMYWDKVLPDTPMPSAIKKLLPQVLAMKPADSGNVVDGAIDLGRRGGGVNNNKPIAENAKSNGESTLFNGLIVYQKENVAKRKSATTENAKSNGESTLFNGLIVYQKENVAKRKSATTENAKSNGESTLFNGLIVYQKENVANRKSATTENAKSNGESTLFNGLIVYQNENVAKRKSATTENAKSNDHAAIPTKLSHVEQLKNDPDAAIFFLRNDLRPGKQSTLQLAASYGRFASFIPREDADAIPFSNSELPSILSGYSIPPSSDEAVAMRKTLLICEMLPMEGEVKRCLTSLEAMVDFATIRLGTRDVVPMSMEGEGAYVAEFRTYTVKAVKKVAEAVVAGGKGAVSCHPQPYPYAVFACHSLTTTEVYSVDLITEDDDGVAMVINLPAICHLDTSRWIPEHISLKALGMKPGEGVVCHFIPQDHVTWVAKL